MRIDADDGYRGTVFDCEACCEVEMCKWVDDVTNEYAVWKPSLKPSVAFSVVLTLTIIKARRIQIVRADNPILALINPVEDDDAIQIRKAKSHERPESVAAA